MDESKKSFKPKKLKFSQMTEEQKAAHLAVMEQAAKDRKAEEERLAVYQSGLEKMSHRQLRSVLVKTIKSEHAGRPPVPQAGLTIALSTILLTVLDNTQTKENPFAKLGSYPR
jgi:hypothetical protein